ncbi:hypothetical protein ACF3DV_20430 [Chlorogloeopsis fritschii PCC 9212]|uniref:Uncharacterized protein n=1 Tax=Chlorogloeopsis fritschii PCC 6912 TaxID=211165 RepID=A0A433NN83_CHLFR|nr:hypothetical protein [Chlorogloeopsis fritschii]RUR84670.1 hypothetical protein PCC6912_15650 [Chlorogloeopsis fritschii PCC 6912]
MASESSIGGFHARFIPKEVFCVHNGEKNPTLNRLDTNSICKRPKDALKASSMESGAASCKGGSGFH